MAKHIHLHLAPGMRVTGTRTGDAGNWDESKHKRADDGKFGSGGGSAKAAPAKSAPAKSKAPTAPNLPGPKAQAAIKAIQAAASKGDWRAVANVNTLGTHPQVTNYRNEMAKHVEGGGKALTEAVGKPEVSKEAQRGAKPPTSLTHGGKKYTSTGKVGKTSSGEASHEYEAVDNEGRRTGARVWRTASGKVIPD